MQGSQAERVIAVLPAGRLLDRTMIYTALTRAVTQLVLIGERSAIEARLRLSLRLVRTCAESASVFDGQYLREAEHLEAVEFWLIWQLFFASGRTQESLDANRKCDEFEFQVDRKLC